jgi:hypothetical protein
VTWTASYATSADTWSAKTTISTGTFTVSGTLANYSAQISVPAAATTGIEILFTVGAQTSGTWVIGNAQLEKSSIATTFDYRPYGTELALCQRYYRQTTGVANTEPSFYGYAIAAANMGTTIVFPVPMRITPTITIKSGVFTSSNCATPAYISSADAYLVYSVATTSNTTYFQSNTAVLAFNGAEL